MRRVVLFLLIFGAGFAVLWMFRAKPAHHDDRGANEAQPQPGQFTELESPSTQSAHQKIGITFNGSAHFIQSKDVGGTLRPEIEVDSKHLQAVSEDVYDMHDLTVHLYDPETQKKRADLFSPLATAKLTTAGDQPRLSQKEPIHLTNVDMTLFEGGPVVPLHLEVPALDWTIGELPKTESFDSNDRVQVHGNGLQASGTGLIAKMSDSSLQLKRDAQIVFDLENGHQVTLGSGLTGPIVVSKVLADGVELVDVTASEGARFDVSGDNPVSIRARTIHMVGRKSTTSPNGYAIVSADAREAVHATSHGDAFDAEKADFTFSNGAVLAKAILDEHVVLTGGTDTFAADHAEFEFEQKAGGTQGQLTKATLTGSPTGTIELGHFVPPNRIDLQNARGKLSGAGPLVLTREDEDHVDFKGPAKLEIPDAGMTLSAEQRIFGKYDGDKKTGSLTAEGTSVLAYGTNDIHSDSLDLSWSTDTDDITKLAATTHGITTVNGVSDTGGASTLIAVGGLDATSIGNKLTITQARDVEIVSTERGGTSAHMDVLNQFDWDKRSFSASGKVTFKSADGEGTGERISVVSRDEVHLYGSPSSPASFRFLIPNAKPGSEASLSGNEVVVTPGAASADGAVKARVQNADNQLDLECTHLDMQSPRPDAANAPRDFHVHATGDVRSHWKKFVPEKDKDKPAVGERIVESTADVNSEDLVVDGVAKPGPVPGANPTVPTPNVVARTAVHVEYHSTSEMTGDGDLFTLDEKGRGRLSADPDKVVHAHGHLVGTAMPYTLAADWIEFDTERVEASKVRLKMDESTTAAESAAVRDAQTPEQNGPGASTAVLGEVRADTMHADKKEIFLDGSAHVDGITGQGEVWTIDAGSIRMKGDFADARSLRTDKIAVLEARGGFHAQLGDRFEARGDTLDGTPEHLRIEGAPARLLMLDAEWQSARIDYDKTNMLLSTDQGSMRSRVGSPGPSWSLEYESMQPFDRDDRTILVLRNPRLRTGSKQLFAEWMLFWVDRNEWRKSGTHTMSQAMNGTELRVNEPDQTVARSPHAPVTSGPQQNPLGLPAWLIEIQSNPVLRVLSEVYIEGNIEIFEQGEREARASAIYLDITETQGWIQDADVSIDVDVRGFKRRLRTRANWMRISPEPALRADKAEITACDFDTPHYVIETSDLRIRPKTNASDRRVAYDISARGNRIRFENGLRLPLPPLVFESDQEGNPLVDRFVLGNSAKYGAAVRATVNAELGPVGQATGRAIASVLRFPATDIRGSWHYNVGILGSRGILFGPGITLRAGNTFRMEMEYDIIPDRGSDKGLVRVDEDDRSLFRTWFHARARYTVADGEWFDLAVSHQSDAGIQSEFFEHQYLRYEEKDTYLHWRKAKDEWYFNASAKVLTEDRTDTAELPSAGAYLGRTRIAEAFDNPVYYTGRVDAGYYQRNDGDPRYYEPFEDGLGDRNLTRIDTEHRVEMPFALGFLDARGTPYVDARGTVWSEGADPDNSPSRAALIVGFDAATTFWKRYSNGAIHTITPSVGVHGDVVSEENGGDLVHIDQTEDPITGRYVDVGVRTRWWLPDTLEHLDFDVRVSEGSDLAEGQRSGLQPVAVLADFLTYVKSVPIGMTQDGRYDVRTGKTVYSLSSLGIEPWENLGVEFGYQRGLSTDEETRLFESASVAFRYRMSPKWEVEFGQSYAIAQGTGVGNAATLRRLGHDFVTEIGVGYRSGEGSTFTIGFEPRITWKRSGLGLLDRELTVYH